MGFRSQGREERRNREDGREDKANAYAGGCAFSRARVACSMGHGSVPCCPALYPSGGLCVDRCMCILGVRTFLHLYIHISMYLYIYIIYALCSCAPPAASAKLKARAGRPPPAQAVEANAPVTAEELQAFQELLTQMNMNAHFQVLPRGTGPWGRKTHTGKSEIGLFVSFSGC